MIKEVEKIVHVEKAVEKAVYIDRPITEIIHAAPQVRIQRVEIPVIYEQTPVINEVIRETHY